MSSDYIQSLQTRLTNAEESLRLVQERQSEFVQAVNIPLELVRDERRLQKEVAELRAALEQVLADKTCPYRSLQPFGQEHASFFFGREEVVSKLVEKVRTNGLVVVVGPSGSGKSSLLQAGLIHTLKASGQAWEDVTFRPRKAPLDGLASALVDST